MTRTPEWKLRCFDWLPVARWSVNTLIGPANYCKICDKWVETNLENHIKNHVKHRKEIDLRLKAEAKKRREEALKLAREERKRLKKLQKGDV